MGENQEMSDGLYFFHSGIRSRCKLQRDFVPIISEDILADYFGKDMIAHPAPNKIYGHRHKGLLSTHRKCVS